MGFWRKTSLILGVLQISLGLASISLSYLLYHNIWDVRGILNVTDESVDLTFVILLFTGIIFVANSLFLISGWMKSKI